MKTELKIVFHEEKCIQCHGCELACKMSKPTQDHIYRRKIVNVWHGEFPNVTCSSKSLACKHCDDPDCMKVCPVGAITKDANIGAVIVDTDLCVGCKACQKACPWDIPQFRSDRKMDKCDMCFTSDGVAACVKTCPTGALELILAELPE